MLRSPTSRLRSGVVVSGNLSYGLAFRVAERIPHIGSRRVPDPGKWTTRPPSVPSSVSVAYGGRRTTPKPSSAIRLRTSSLVDSERSLYFGNHVAAHGLVEAGQNRRDAWPSAVRPGATRVAISRSARAIAVGRRRGATHRETRAVTALVCRALEPANAASTSPRPA